MPDDPELTERLAAELHEVYQVEAKRQGDVRHKDSYAELSENIKEFDRVLARHVITLLRAERVKLLEMSPCGRHPVCVYKEGFELCANCGYELLQHQNYVADKTQPSDCASYRAGKVIVGFCPLCAERVKVRRETLEEAIRECDRHARFCKHEKENGGNYEHLKTRQDEAEYLAGRLRSFALAETGERDGGGEEPKR